MCPAHLIKLLEQGAIPCTMVETHRHIPVGELLAYKQRRDERRHAGLAELTQMSQEMGMYDHQEVGR